MIAAVRGVFAEVARDPVVNMFQQLGLLGAATPIAFATDCNHLTKLIGTFEYEVPRFIIQVRRYFLVVVSIS